MDILVCVKQVPDDSVEIKVKKESNQPNLENVDMIVNAFDTYALEMATRFKEENGGEITVISLGDDGAKDAIKSCFSVGANKGYLVSDEKFNNSDILGVSYILSKTILKLEQDLGKKFDVIFCGKESTDITSGQVGAQLSQNLERALSSNIIEINLKNDSIETKQETEDGYNVVETSIPCVVTATKPNYEPRYPTIKSKMAARKMEIGIIDSKSIEGIDLGKVGVINSHVKMLRFYEPCKKQSGIKIQEETCVDSAIKAVGIMAESKVF